MVSTPPGVLLGDGSTSRFGPHVLDALAQLVVCAAEVGRSYGEYLELRNREAEADEKAASVRADLQRFARQTEIGMRATAKESAWPELRHHADRAVVDLQAAVKRWQRQHTKDAERSKRRLAAEREKVAATMHADVSEFLAQRVTEFSGASILRRLGDDGYVDVLNAQLTTGLRVELLAASESRPPLQRVREFTKKAVVHAGVRKTLLGRTAPRTLKLDDLYIVEAVLGPAAVDVRLAPKPRATTGLLLLRLRLERGVVQGKLSLGNDQHEQPTDEDQPVLDALWQALQDERARVCGTPATVQQIVLDEKRAQAARHYFEVLERVVEGWRPTVAELAAHTPSPEELSVRMPQPDGHHEELWVRRADLTQHLLTIPPALRERLSPAELLGPPEVTVESDLIDMGRIMTPDAGGDSDVIELHYIAPASETAAPSAVYELLTDDIQVLQISQDPEEKSGCYDLSKLQRTATE